MKWLVSWSPTVWQSWNLFVVAVLCIVLCKERKRNHSLMVWLSSRVERWSRLSSPNRDGCLDLKASLINCTEKLIYKTSFNFKLESTLPTSLSKFGWVRTNFGWNFDSIHPYLQSFERYKRKVDSHVCIPLSWESLGWDTHHYWDTNHWIVVVFRLTINNNDNAYGNLKLYLLLHF